MNDLVLVVSDSRKGSVSEPIDNNGRTDAKGSFAQVTDERSAHVDHVLWRAMHVDYSDIGRWVVGVVQSLGDGDMLLSNEAY